MSSWKVPVQRVTDMGREKRGPKSATMPTVQILALAFCRLSQPLALGSTMAYLPEYIESIGIHQSKVALTASMAIATFALCESFAAIPWAALSDKIGWKLTIVIALGLVMCANLGFGFSNHLWQALLCTGLAGLSSGIVSVLRTFLSEIVPQRDLQARAFAALPAAAGAGFIMGPALGGYLSQVSKRYDETSVFHSYPFAIPNICTATIFLVAVIIASALLTETVRANGRSGYQPLPSTAATQGEMRLSIDEQFHDKDVQAAVPLSDLGEKLTTSKEMHDAPAAMSTGRNVLVKLRAAFAYSFGHMTNASIWSFSMVTLNSSGYDNLLPVFLHYGHDNGEKAINGQPMGLGKDTKTVGLILTSYGIVGLIATLCLNPIFCKIWTPSRVLRSCAFGLAMLYAAFALAVEIRDQTVREVAIFACMIMKMCLAISAMQSCLLVMPQMVKPEQLARLHGLNATVAAIAKALGAVLGGVAFSVSTKYDFAGGPWWTLMLMAGLAIYPSMKLGSTVVL